MPSLWYIFFVALTLSPVHTERVSVRRRASTRQIKLLLNIV